MDDSNESDAQKILGIPRREFVSSSSKAIPREKANEAPNQAESLGMPRREYSAESVERIQPNEKNLFLESSIEESLETTETTEATSKSLRSLDRVFVCLTVVVFGLALLFFASQALNVWGQVQSLPSLGRWFAYVSLTTITVAILVAMGYLIWQFMKLRETPSVSIMALKQLHERSATRVLAIQSSRKAAERLEQFLREYPLEAKDLPQLKKLGFETEIEVLQQTREQLLASAQGGSRLFVTEVNDYFLSKIDEVAKRRIHDYAQRVGTKTAIAPSGVLDSGIVIVHSYLLIGDLCRIYNVRATKGSILYILGLSLINMIAASGMEDATESAASVLTQGTSLLHGIPFAGEAIKGLTARATEGAANLLLLRKLGYATLRQLRPIKLD